MTENRTVTASRSGVGRREGRLGARYSPCVGMGKRCSSDYRSMNHDDCDVLLKAA